MERGDQLPDPVTGARWPDGREYVASSGMADPAAASESADSGSADGDESQDIE